MFGEEFVFWYWWVLALAFLIIELLAPGFFFLWMAASGFITGCLVLMLPIGMNMQILIFSVLSILAIGAWKYYFKKMPIESDRPLLNKRGAQYIGRVFNLYEPIENGQGKVKVDDTIWKVEGEDCGLETKVKVIAINGTVFSVQKVP